jgi:hypothetical protein
MDEFDRVMVDSIAADDTIALSTEGASDGAAAAVASTAAEDASAEELDITHSSAA